uniref:PUM-HD domain-containing protein n=1 Tax=Sphaeramia orbicularis TaxID=375764 RepID=A0A672Z5F4_9TELE
RTDEGEMKKERLRKKKELKRTRQQAERKDMFDIICKAKKVWGELRRCWKSSKVRGRCRFSGFAVKPTPLVHCVLVFVSDDVIALCKSQYGRHVVKKLLMYGSGNKEVLAALMQAFKGHVRPMLRHAAASSIIEYAYNDKAVLAQRLMLTEELYGNTFTFCKSNTSESCCFTCCIRCKTGNCRIFKITTLIS